MKVNKIFFQHFRSFKQQELIFSDVTLLFGSNGSGKTSVAEGLYLLASGESFRANKIDEMVAFTEELARVGVRLVDGDDQQDADVLEMTLTKGLVQGKRARKRLYAINGAGKQRKSFIGKFLVVVFQPADMRLVEGSPARRRSFIDNILRLNSVEYAQSLHSYEQALKRRNKFLEQVRDGDQPRTVLQYWEQMMVKHGQLVQQHRHHFFEFLRQLNSPFDFNVRYLISKISQSDIEERRDRAIAAGHTLVGPHKDDFAVMFAGEELENRELSAYGSRGQQRLGVLWLKLGELRFLEQQQEQQPLLILDDIFSELDEQAEELVLDLVGEYQTVITTANDDTLKFLKAKLPQVKTIKMNGN